MLTIEPPPFFSMPGMNAFIVRCIDFTLRSNEKSDVLLGAVEHAAVVDVAGDVDQHVEPAEFLAHGFGQRVDVAR